MNANKQVKNLSYDWMCQIFRGPVVTAKSYDRNADKIYTVQVHPDADKTSIMKAFVELFEIKPVSVNIIVSKGKVKQRRASKVKSVQVKMPATKKAMIRLPADAKFDFATEA